MNRWGDCVVCCNINIKMSARTNFTEVVVVDQHTVMVLVNFDFLSLLQIFMGNIHCVTPALPNSPRPLTYFDRERSGYLVIPRRLSVSDHCHLHSLTVFDSFYPEQ